MTDALDAVAAAADDLVRAFGAHDHDAYFAAFSSDATFIFHSTPRMLASRAEYQAEWAAWEKDGFHVESCETSERRLAEVSEDVVILTHRVLTRLRGVDTPIHERETIVFAKGTDGRWLAVHEHLSPDPRGEQ